MKKADLVAELERRDAMSGDTPAGLTMNHLAIWQTLIDAIPAPVFYKDPEHRYLGCNKAFEAYIGLAQEKVVGASVYDVAPKELADIYRDADDRLFAAGGSQVYQTQVQYADGSLHDVMFHKAVFNNPDGSLGGIVGIMLDVTEREEAQRALKTSQNRFVQLVENMPEAIFVHDQDGKILQVNEQACQSLGYDREALLGMEVSDIEIGAPAEDLRHVWADLTNQVLVLQGRHRRQSGDTFPVEVHLCRIESGDDGPLFIAAARDMSIHIAAEERLLAAKQEAEHANRVKTEFLANISHELRTPLNAILGFSEVIRQQILGPLGNETYISYASDIHQSGGHLLQIIDELLDLSRLEIGDMSLDEAQSDVAEMISGAIHMLETFAETNEVTIEAKLGDGLPKLVCDSRRITQVFINILNNAVKFTLPGGQVLVTAKRRENGDLQIDFADTGIGISARDLPRVLQPFEQLENPLTRQYAGSGLGLALSKNLIEAHEGELHIDSVPDQGTTVSVVFPHTRLAGRA